MPNYIHFQADSKGTTYHINREYIAAITVNESGEVAIILSGCGPLHLDRDDGAKFLKENPSLTNPPKAEAL